MVAELEVVADIGRVDGEQARVEGGDLVAPESVLLAADLVAAAASALQSGDCLVAGGVEENVVENIVGKILEAI